MGLVHRPRIGYTPNMWLTQVLLRLAAPLALLFTATVGLIHAQPSEGALRELGIAPPSSDCPYASWLGICPGRTTAEEAMSILEAHPWVENPAIKRRWINWAWSGEQPAWYGGRPFHGLVATDDIVRLITLRTRAAGNILLAALPQGITFLYLDPASPGLFVATYWDESLEVMMPVQCPVHMLQLAVTESSILIGVPRTLGQMPPSETFDGYDMLPVVNQRMCGG